MIGLKFDPSAVDRALDGLGSALTRPAVFIERAASEWLAEVEREQFRSEGRARARGATWGGGRRV